MSGLVFIGAGLLFSVLSYGFIDPNLSLGAGSLYESLRQFLTGFVYGKPLLAASLYAAIVVVLFWCYRKLLTGKTLVRIVSARRYIAAVFLIFLFSYPALSYDIFNYILTSKVAFFYRENPYVVMPVEIPNEPALSYTRAANKLALYGPTWITLSALPYAAGRLSVITSILSFKLFAGLFYSAMLYFIYRKTKRVENVVFLATNPLVLFEVLSSGHNDIAMMVLAVGGLILWNRKAPSMKIAGMVLYISSVLVKGATIALIPLFFFPRMTWEKKSAVGFWLMFAVFLVSPLREELYPWYAVWWLSFAAFVPFAKRSFIHEFSFAVSFSLMLRYIPWIATREYGGVTPVIRETLSLLPVVLFFAWRYRNALVKKLSL